LDGEAGVPLLVHARGQPVHQAQPLGVRVDEGQRAAAQRGLTQQRGEGVEAEDGAAGANDHNFDGLHKCSYYQCLPCSSPSSANQRRITTLRSQKKSITSRPWPCSVPKNDSLAPPKGK